jgi:hypothetical protein
MESPKGLIRVNADCSQGRIAVGVIHEGRRIKTLELAGSDTLDRRFQSAKRGEIILDVTVENAKLYSLEVT